MRRVLLLSLCVFPLYCQTFSFGIKAGLPLGDAEGIVTDGRDSFDVHTQRWTAGATVELKLPGGAAIGADALYRRFSFSDNHNYVVTTFTNGKTGHWEFPVYLKYRFGGPLLRPFLEAGLAFDHAHTSGTSGCTGSLAPNGEPLCGSLPASSTFSASQWGVGELVGAGIEFKAALLKVAPELRYTRWGKGVFNNARLGLSTLTEPNQLEVLVGIRF